MTEQIDYPIAAEPAEYAKLRQIAASALAAEEMEFWQLLCAERQPEPDQPWLAAIEQQGVM